MIHVTYFCVLHIYTIFVQSALNRIDDLYVLNIHFKHSDIILKGKANDVAEECLTTKMSSLSFLNLKCIIAMENALRIISYNSKGVDIPPPPFDSFAKMDILLDII